MGQIVGADVPLSEDGELGPYQTKCGLGPALPYYRVAPWSIQPFGHNRHEPKIRGHAPLLGGGAGSPSNNVDWAEAYLRTKWHLDPCICLATIHMSPKVGGCCSPLGGSWDTIQHNVAWAEAYLPAKWNLDLSSRLATTDNVISNW